VDRHLALQLAAYALVLLVTAACAAIALIRRRGFAATVLVGAVPPVIVTGVLVAFGLFQGT
jgi:hypothetical protein